MPSGPAEKSNIPREQCIIDKLSYIRARFYSSNRKIKIIIYIIIWVDCAWYLSSPPSLFLNPWIISQRIGGIIFFPSTSLECFDDGSWNFWSWYNQIAFVSKTHYVIWLLFFLHISHNFHCLQIKSYADNFKWKGPPKAEGGK